MPVRVGLTDGTVTKIVDGDLHEGDQVVVEALGGDDAATTAKPGGQAPRMRPLEVTMGEGARRQGRRDR